jgi:lactate racemase
MRFILGYYKESRDIEISDQNIGHVLEPRKSEAGGKGESGRSETELVEASLDSASELLKETIRPGEKVVIVTSDITRPMPSYKVLPSLIRRLGNNGISDSDIRIVLALGNHRKHTREEMEAIVGSGIFARIECIDSDHKNIVRLGTTRRGTPVDLFRPVVEADKRICLGNVEYHYFAGYSGGMKAIMPGVSTAEAIQANHSHMVEANAYAGRIEGNPVREDIDEVYSLCPANFIVNVVLDEKKKIVKAFAGDAFAAHREGCAFLDTLYKCSIDEPADIVIVTPGGFPKDLNLYQAQKALDNAKHAVKAGGIIILLAACPEGFGESVFERWMTTSSSPEQMVEDIRVRFELGGHKAAAIGMVQQKADIFLVSEFSPDLVRRIFMTPFTDIQEALEEAIARKGKEASVHIMPFGGSTLPVVS